MAEWEAVTGDPDWSPTSATNTFIHLENYNGSTNDKHVRGYHGPIDIREAGPTQSSRDLVRAVARAHSEQGGLPQPKLFDYNNPHTVFGGFSRWQLYQTPSGRRVSSSTAMLTQEVLVRPNLELLLQATVTKVLFKDKKAIGVMYIENGESTVVFCRKKVILSAGIHSPTILQQSGVGPADLLKELGIPVVYDNPNVGYNMTNHMVTTVTFTSDTNPSSDPNNLFSGGAFLPDPLGTTAGRSVELIGNDAPGFFIIAVLMNTLKSTGYATIQSVDPLSPVIASDNALSYPTDLNTIIACYREQIVPIAEQLHRIDPAYRLVTPSAEVIANDIALTQYIESTLTQAYHWQSQCKMMSVVDSGGNVYGVERLMVVDNSIAPVPVDCNMSSVAYMMGYIIAKKLMEGC